MATTWIVAADSSRARILQVAGRQRLDEVDYLLNPAGRMNDRELTTDANPRRHGPGGQSAPDEPSAVEHTVEVFSKRIGDYFSKRIGDYLEKARTDHRFDQLVLVAEELPKDLSWFNERELERYFEKGSGRAP